MSNPISKMRRALEGFVPNAIAEAMLRLDSWTNPMTGFGTSRDKTTYGSMQPFVRISDVELSSLYHGYDMAARMVDVVPNEMLREGFDIDIGDPAANTVLAEKFDDLNVARKFGDGIRWGRLYGGAAVLVGAEDGQDASKPLKAERAKDIKYLYVIERRVLWPLTYYTEPGHPKLGEPETYLVTPQVAGGVGSGTVVVHESRLIVFRGAKTGAFERLAWAGWDISVLQRPYEVLRQFDVGWKALETLLVDGNQAVFKMTGLAEMIAAGGQEPLRRRLSIIEMYRSVMRALVIDAESEESYERTSVSFEGVHQVLDKLMLRLAAAVQIPVTILMGQSPAGMNSTGDSDFRWFYDKIRAEQTTELAPKLRRLADIWLRTKAGQDAIRGTKVATKTASTGVVLPETITVEFPPLWTSTPKEEAERRLAIAQADQIYLEEQVLLPEEVALSRFRPEGFDGDSIALTDKARASREKLLGIDLPKLASGELAAPDPATLPTGAPSPMGTPKPNPMPNPAPPGGTPPA